MAFIKNKILYVLDEDGVTYIPFTTVKGELFLTADAVSGIFSFNDYSRAIRSKSSKHIVRLYLLNEDETIKKDISEYLISGSIDLNYQKGQTRSCNIVLRNSNKEWIPSPVKGNLWKGIKYRIDLGLYYRGTVFWKQCGIFTPANPNLSSNRSNKTISLQMYDKFSLLDGTIGGKSIKNFSIAVGTKIKDAIKSVLFSDMGNGRQYDYKSLIFPSEHENKVTSHTITITPNSNLGNVILELVWMISCDVYYNSVGNLTVSSIPDGSLASNKPILWNYSEKDSLYFDFSMEIDYTSIVNQVTVYGAIVNGYQYKATAYNVNPKSQSNIYLTLPNPEEITDSNLNSDELCMYKAVYELKRKLIIACKSKFKSVFIPHLDINNLILLANSDYDFNEEKFLMSNIHLEIGTSMISMDINASNINEVDINA